MWEDPFPFLLLPLFLQTNFDDSYFLSDLIIVSFVAILDGRSWFWIFAARLRCFCQLGLLSDLCSEEVLGGLTNSCLPSPSPADFEPNFSILPSDSYNPTN